MSNTGLPEFLQGGGEMGERIREFNWADNPLGPVETWPQSLRTCVRIMLTSRQPMWIGWGKDHIKLYNDAYKSIAGEAPWAPGQPASAVWKDIWAYVGPLLEKVMKHDEGTYAESQLLIMERNGYPEETYYTFSYTPIPGDDGVTGGMLCANTDDTIRITGDRQLKTLTHLGQRLTDCQLGEDVIRKTMLTLHENPYDFPFAVFYQYDNGKALMASHAGNEELPPEIDLHAEGPLSEQFRTALATRKPQILTNQAALLAHMPRGRGKFPQIQPSYYLSCRQIQLTHTVSLCSARTLTACPTINISASLCSSPIRWPPALPTFMPSSRKENGLPRLQRSTRPRPSSSPISATSSGHRSPCCSLRWKKRSMIRIRHQAYEHGWNWLSEMCSACRNSLTLYWNSPPGSRQDGREIL